MFTGYEERPQRQRNYVMLLLFLVILRYMVPGNDVPRFVGVGDRLIVVCIADTHGQHRRLRIPRADILIHAGDFTSPDGSYADFDAWLGSLKQVTHKVVIPGSKDRTFEYSARGSPMCECCSAEPSARCTEPQVATCVATADTGCNGTAPWSATCAAHAAECGAPCERCGLRQLTHALLLQDAEVMLSGLRIYGSSWQPTDPEEAFYLPRSEIKAKWDTIPADADVIITHTPPAGLRDRPSQHSPLGPASWLKPQDVATENLSSNRTDGQPGGCEELAIRSRAVVPKVHVFGRIHDGRGFTRVLNPPGSRYGESFYINAAMLNEQGEVASVKPYLWALRKPKLSQPFTIE